MITLSHFLIDKAELLCYGKPMSRQYLRDHDPDDEVTTGCIIFGGQSINLHRMADANTLDYSYLYRVFRGERTPSIAYARKIAAALNMTTLAFLAALDSHVGLVT